MEERVKKEAKQGEREREGVSGRCTPERQEVVGGGWRCDEGEGERRGVDTRGVDEDGGGRGGRGEREELSERVGGES